MVQTMTVVLFASLVLQVVNFLKGLVNFRTERSALLTQLCAWAGGFVLVLIGAHAAVTAALVLPGADRPLHALDISSIILIGMLVGSAASTGVDFRNAFDNTASAKRPPLVPPS